MTGPVVPAGQTNVNVAPAAPVAPVWTLTRVVTLVFTVLEVLLLIRFLMRLTGAKSFTGS